MQTNWQIFAFISLPQTINHFQSNLPTIYYQNVTNFIGDQNSKSFKVPISIMLRNINGVSSYYHAAILIIFIAPVSYLKELEAYEALIGKDKRGCCIM
jgi:hypothetical protein